MKTLGIFAAGTIAIAALLMTAAGRTEAHRAKAAPVPADAPTPVLVELFTSEGCSDCPPADAFLATLDQSQPVTGAEVIALSEHVDYWDSDAWRDPYSSHDLTERQQDYAERFGLDSPYTPQMVVDGREQFVGSDESTAFADIGKEAAIAKTPIQLSQIRVMGETHVAMHIDIHPDAALLPTFSGDIWLALADEKDQSSVKAGENGGRVLYHVAVVRHFVRMGDVYHSAYSSGGAYYTGNANLRGLRIIAFVQQGTAGKIIAIGTAQLPE
jgi:hypothetical protein